MTNNLYRLRRFSLRNFWCYGEDGNYLEMGDVATVIIGLNGAGKTAFLTAVKKALSFILSKDRRKEVRFIGDGKDIKDCGLSVDDVRFDEAEGLYDYEYHYPVEIHCEAQILGMQIQWVYAKPDKRTRVDKMYFREALDEILRPLNDYPTRTLLPLLAYFSDSYPHVKPVRMKYEKDILVNKSDKIERRAGYYHWDLNSASFYFWRDLFVATLRRYYHPITGYDATLKKTNEEDLDGKVRLTLEKNLQSLMASRIEIDYVLRYLREFSKTFPTHDNEDFAVDNIVVGSYLENNKEIFTLQFVFKDGHKRNFESLPEGHKRLLAIAFEISYRFFILNRNIIVQEPQTHPQGIALVDELELHLHPTLAQESLIRLTQTFPQVQFIITTHSPAIISNIHNDGRYCKIYRLDRDHRAVLLDDFFGAEYGDTLVLSMGSYGRLHQLEMLEEMYREYSQDGNNEGKHQVESELEELFRPSEMAKQWMRETIDNWERSTQ